MPQCTGTATRGRISATASAALDRVEVPGAEVGAPAPDGQQRDVDGPLAEHGHAVEQVGVAAGVDGAAVALEQVADATAVAGPWVSRGPEAVAAVLGADAR